MAVIINGDTGIDKITDGSIVQADLASGVAGTGPAFGAYQSSTQSIANLTEVKITFNVEEFDLTGDYDNTTNYRFTPSVEGYYQLNGKVSVDSTNDIMIIKLNKNGTEFKRGVTTRDADTAGERGATVSSLVYANGTTDYFEIYVVHNGGATKNTAATQFQTWFNGFLARAV